MITITKVDVTGKCSECLGSQYYCLIDVFVLKAHSSATF
jgi:hypothetical protein